MQRQNVAPHYPIDYETFALSEMLGPASTAKFPPTGNEGLFPLPIPHQSSAFTADLGRNSLPIGRGGSFSLPRQGNMRISHPQATLDFSSLQQSVRETLQPVPSRSLPEYLTRDNFREQNDDSPRDNEGSRSIQVSTKEIVREQNRRAAARFRQRQKVRCYIVILVG